MKKAFTKKNFVRIFFVLLFGFSLYLIANILSIKSEHGVDQIAGLYWQPKDSIDVVFMGTSHVHCGINTGLLWEKYGIAAYDYSGAEQPLWMTYYYLKEFYKYQSPSVVVLDLYGPARYKEDYQYDWMSENIHGMKFSLNKLEMMSVSVEPQNLYRYFPSFATYHSRYDDIDENDYNDFFWNSQEKEAFKGYTPYWDKAPQVKREVFETDAVGLTFKSEKYLRKIIELVKSEGSELVLITIPYIEIPEDRKTYEEATLIASQEGVILINYNQYFDSIGLNLEEDFHDDSHLNYWGSSKFSDYIGDFLMSFEGVEDNRNVPGYESWDENAKLIKLELESYKNRTLQEEE